MVIGKYCKRFDGATHGMPQGVSLNAPYRFHWIKVLRVEGGVLHATGAGDPPGIVEEVEMAGGKLMRIDIPTEGGDVTEFYGASAIYALRPCSEEIARRMSNGYHDPRPVRPVEYRERETPKITQQASDFDADY